MDQGLAAAGGAGNFLNSFTESYLRTKKMNQDEQYQNFQKGLLQAEQDQRERMNDAALQHQQFQEGIEGSNQDINLAEHNMEKDPATGQVRPTAVGQAQKESGLLSAGYVKDQTGNFVPGQGLLNKQKLDQEMADPNSDTSKGIYNHLKQAAGKYGENIPEGMSGAELQRIYGEDVINLAKAKMQGEAAVAKMQPIVDQKAQQMDLNYHKSFVQAVKNNPVVKQRITQYQNLDNSLNNMANADSLTPQQFDEAQQSIRANLGIKGSSGVDERSHTYLNSLGLNADRWQQLLTGKPASMSKDDPFIKHITQLATLEKQNISAQMDRSLNAAAAGGGSFYAKHPDLKQDLMDVVNAERSQYGGDGSGGQSGGGTAQGDSSSQYTPDVVKYAKDHGLTNDQALAIKNKRGGS